jgi:hypothetical protein
MTTFGHFGPFEMTTFGHFGPSEMTPSEMTTIGHPW